LLVIDSAESHPVGLLKYRSDPATLKEMRDRVREMVLSAGAAVALTEAIVVAINEACMNVIQHGYRGNTEGVYELRVTYNKTRNALIFELLDQAPPVDQTEIKSRSLEDVRPGGLGVYFIRQLMDEMDFCTPPEGYGNRLYMSVRMDKQNPLEMT
jgi:anti-sigma regulatory factor (Ser/Thr protein kinase)